MIPAEQIERFFKKQCTADEAQQVAGWLAAHPELVNQYLDEAEWQQSLDDEHLHEKMCDSAWQQINKNIRKRKAVLLLKHCAVAACAIGCIVSCFLYFNQNHSATKQTTYAKIAVQIVALTDTEYNRTNKPRRIVLKDSSVISLLPKATVWFDTPFTKSRRDIHLEGEAIFEVAKDKQKPFTVYAGAFATTALGTEFSVKQQADNIQIQLLHGKVVISVTDSHIKNWKNVYLLPGQQLIYNQNNAIAQVSAIANKKAIATSKAVQNNTQSETADNLIFNGTAMPAVLFKLGKYYNIQLQFNEADLKKMSFTGIVAKKDTVQHILRVITQMNGLSVEKTDSSFIVSKNKE